jgi:endonuclease/exonuclease/phosphatase family metal-dependent hydrolase
MKLRLIFLVVGLYGITILGQTRIKVMSYNLMHYPGTLYYNDATNTFEDRTPVLKNILDTYEPDLFAVCELKNSTGAGQILNEALQTPDDRYNAADFVYNQSSTYTELQQLIFYNQQKLLLNNQAIITTNIRDINHYSFILNTIDHNTNPIYLEVFVAHLKASSGSDNETKRLQMVTEFTNYIENIPTDHYLLFVGDLNLYYDNEPAYQELIDSTNNIVLVDPIDREGYWHNSSSYADIHTQSTLQNNSQFQSESGGSDGVTGGLDDRFDFILTSENLINGSSLTYVPNTYKSYGNNGNCFNDNINDSDCSGEYSQYLRDQLANMSDHLPVVMELETPETIGINQYHSQYLIKILGSNLVNAVISLEVPVELIDTNIRIYNQFGQQVLQKHITDTNESFSISHLNSGLYYITSEQFSLHSPLKFIKI